MNTTIETGIRSELLKFNDHLITDSRTDGTSFIRLADDSPEKYVEIVRDLHMDELPNDWRYNVIKELVTDLLDYFDPEDEMDEDNCQEALHEIVETVVPCSSHEVFKWLADRPARAVFEDTSWADMSSYADEYDLVELARTRMYEEISIMGSNLVYHFTSGF